jgi:hypothetical protein
MNRSNPTLESILAEAVEIPAATERQAFIAQACSGNPELLTQVERLVANHFRAGSFLESPVVVLDMTTFATPLKGTETHWPL